MPQSKNIPQIRKLQGKVQIPYNVQQKTRTDEDGNEETYYTFDRLKIDQAQLPSSDQVKRELVEALRSDLHQHIYPEYDQGTQSSIQALAQKADRDDQTEIVDKCEEVFDWIESCLDYYYDKKDKISSAEDESSLIQVSWDFVENVPKPSGLKSLREIKDMFS